MEVAAAESGSTTLHIAYSYGGIVQCSTSTAHWRWRRKSSTSAIASIMARFRRMLVARRIGRTSAHSRRPGAPILFECALHDGEVLVAEPVIDGLLPFVGQGRERGEAAVVGRLQREMDVLQRERQRELWRVLACRDPLQLGCLPGGHECAAAKGVHHLLGLKPQSASKSQ